MISFLDIFLAFAGIIRGRFYFVVEIFAAELMFMIPGKLKKYPYIRIPVALIAYFAFGFFMPESFLGIGAFITLPIYVLSILLMWFVFDVSPKRMISNCIAGYGVQSLVVRSYELIQYLIGFDENSWYDLANILIWIALYIVAYFTIVRLFHKYHSELPSWTLILSSLMILLATDLMCKSKRFLGADFTILVSMEFSVLIGLALLFSIYLAGKLNDDNKKMEKILAAEQEQYKISRETIDLVNMKCHDLKHQLANIRSGMDEKDSDALKEMEQAVMFYDSVAKTGNKALDSVLTQKSLICERDHINMNYIADGKCISFMKSSDIWSLFANAIDNAIECVRKVEEAKREIFLNITQKESFISITIENFSPESPKFLEGLPQTTKEDTRNHGFGTQSIRYIVKKYDGQVIFHQNEQRFIVSIMIPLKSE